MSIANMGVFAVWPWIPPVLAVILLLLGLFLILLVLIQRGKGGGLAGAFGGAGGSSAFGSRAGDTFTKVTIYVAAGWILLIMILIKTTQPNAETGAQQVISAPNGATSPTGNPPAGPETPPPANP